jgi:hypothetical protein
VKEIILNRFKAVAAYKEREKIVPREVMYSELKRAVLKLFDKEFEALKKEGVILYAGQTINGDEHLKLK